MVAFSTSRLLWTGNRKKDSPIFCCEFWAQPGSTRPRANAVIRHAEITSIYTRVVCVGFFMRKNARPHGYSQVAYLSAAMNFHIIAYTPHGSFSGCNSQSSTWLDRRVFVIRLPSWHEIGGQCPVIGTPWVDHCALDTRRHAPRVHARRGIAAHETTCVCVRMLMSIRCVSHVNMCKRSRWHMGRRGVYGSMYKSVS